MSVHEIAKRAGVSITTVSRVLNNNPGVRPETASQVRKILAQYPYDRHAIRRGPRPGKRVKRRAAGELKHGVISIVVLGRTHEDWFKVPLFAAIVSAITRSAADRHLSIRIEEAIDADGIPASISRDVTDGALVFVAAAAKPDLLDAITARVPVVRVMGDDLVSADVDQVRPDNLAIGHVAYDHLIAQGCRTVAGVTTRADHGAFMLRMLGFAVAGARGAGTPPGTSPPIPGPQIYCARIKPDGPWGGLCRTHYESLDEVAAAIAAASPRPDGLFVTQDLETIGLYPMLARHGIRPGHDIRIVSCNNDESLSMLSPRPTSIDLGSTAIGRWALRRLINRISRPDDAPIQMLVKPTIVPSPDDRV